MLLLLISLGLSIAAVAQHNDMEQKKGQMMNMMQAGIMDSDMKMKSDSNKRNGMKHHN